MSKTNNGKKEFRRQVTEQLESAFQHLKASLGEKKFSNRVKKAAKILADGLPAAEPAAQITAGATRKTSENAAPKKAKAAPATKKAPAKKKVVKGKVAKTAAPLPEEHTTA